MNLNGPRCSLKEGICEGSDKPLSSTTEGRVLISQASSVQEINLDIISFEVLSSK